MNKTRQKVFLQNDNQSRPDGCQADAYHFPLQHSYIAITGSVGVFNGHHTCR